MHPAILRILLSRQFITVRYHRVIAMLFNIEHVTEYHFSRPVFLEPHQFRFQPRNDPAQRLIQFDLAIDPTPAGMTHAETTGIASRLVSAP